MVSTQVTSEAAPESASRVQERRLLDLCAASPFDLEAWLRAADDDPRWDRAFLAGVAGLLAASARDDRDRWREFARRLDPSSLEARWLSDWLKAHDVRPARFLPMLRAHERFVGRR